MNGKRVCGCSGRQDGVIDQAILPAPSSSSHRSSDRATPTILDSRSWTNDKIVKRTKTLTS